jgi:hypothetical protein
MGSVIDPNAARVNELPSRNRRRMSNYRDEVAFASGFHLEDGEPGLGIVERDALDRARESLRWGGVLGFESGLSH